MEIHDGMWSTQNSTIDTVHATASPSPGARLQCVPHVFKLYAEAFGVQAPSDLLYRELANDSELRVAS